MGKIGSLVAVALVIVAGFATAAIVEQAMFPNQMEIEGKLTYYLNDVEFENNSLIDWGKGSKGKSYFYDFNVTNPTENNYTLYLVTYPPVGWTQTWIQNGTLLPFYSSIVGKLILSVSSTVADGFYYWNMTIQAEA